MSSRMILITKANPDFEFFIKHELFEKYAIEDNTAIYVTPEQWNIANLMVYIKKLEERIKKLGLKLQ